MVSFNIEAKNGVILDTFGNYNPENNGCTFSDELVSGTYVECFNTTGDHYTLTGCKNVNIGAADNFTIETWVRINSMPYCLPMIFCTGNNGQGILSGNWSGRNDGVYVDFYGIGGAIIVSYDTNLIDKKFHDICVTKSGITITLYVDGKKISTGEAKSNMTWPNLLIGWDGLAYDRHADITVAQLSVLDECKYTGDYTPALGRAANYFKAAKDSNDYLRWYK